jgi:hypothetical protein
MVFLAVLVPSTAAASSSSVGPAAVHDLLPDMRMAPLYGIDVVVTSSGRKRLTFGTIGWNVGRGPIELRLRLIDEGAMEISQVIYDSAGGHRSRHTSAIAVYDTGDHHSHWHVRQFMRVQLYKPGNPRGNVYGLRKLGYCLLDKRRMPSPPPGSPSVAKYHGCGSRGSTRVREGLSVGYGDDYPPNFTHQWMDVTHVSSGVYRICTTVDPLREFVEGNERNNQRWTDVRLDMRQNTARVIATKVGRCGPG